MKRIRRQRKTLSIVIPFLIIALVFGVLFWKKYRASIPQSQQTQTQEPVIAKSVVLFFAADDSTLEREARDIEPCSEAAECLKDVLDELFSGPVGDLYDAMPEGALVNSVLIQGNIAVVDVNSNFVSEMPSGSSAEMMAVYAIVNTVCANFPQVAQVKLTVEGERKVALQHLDLSEPLSADYTLESKPAQVAGEKAVPKKQ